MRNDRWQRAKDLFHDALERPADERAGFVRGACGEDDELHSRVFALLSAHDDAPEFLETPLPAAGLAPGDTVGPYRLIEKIGAGGFGTVYRAEQVEPVQREVALKILNLGMNSEDITSRFVAERQALALMSHPYIAQVHDAGTTDHGRPYFVMELVEGVPITEYCDRAALGTRERLELFRDVCLAIQHAHHKGIIHRDIKPSNVLVAARNGVPVPKVIDFGIAKAIGPRLTEHTIRTMADQVIGTPEYMSPEQAELTGLDIDTRSDVYSLGVLLYELLTGTTPFDVRTLASKGYNEVMRVIREQEPPRPSTRISTLGARLDGVAESRDTTARGLGRTVRGDLDWIVMKALEKDRSRRYETANGFAMDIARFLDNRPVEAGPPSAGYRVRKFMRRNRTGVIAASLVALALLSGLAFAMVGFVEARAQRDVAREEEKKAKREFLRAKTVVDLMDGAFATTDAHKARGVDYTMREFLVAFDHDLGDKLESEPDVEATLRTTMGRGYRSLGLTEESARNVSRALELRRKLYGESDDRTIDTLGSWAWVQHDRGDYRGALETLQAVAAQRRTGKDDLKLASALNGITDMERHIGNLDAAVKAGREALALYRRAGGTVYGAPVHLTTAYMHQSRPDAAEAVLRELLANFRRGLGAGHPKNTFLLQGLSGVLRNRGKWDEAEKLARRSVAINRKFSGAESMRTVSSLTNVGVVLENALKLEEAEKVMREAVAICRKRGYTGNTLRAAVHTLGSVCRLRDKHDEALKYVTEAEEIAVRLHGKSNVRAAQARQMRGRIHYTRKEYGKAEAAFRSALEVIRAAWGDDHSSVLGTEVMLGRVLYRTSRSPAAEKILRSAVKRLRKHHPELTQHLVGALNGLAISIRNQGRTPLAELKEAYELRVSIWGPARSRTAQFSYGTALVATGSLKEAVPMLREPYEARRKKYGPDHRRTLEAQHALANCYYRLSRLTEAEPIARDLVARRRRLQPGHPDTGGALMLYGQVSYHSRNPTAAERALRECLDIRKKTLPKGHWLAFDTMSLLGASLEELKRYDEAEPLLLESYAGLKPPPNYAYTKEWALQRIVNFYSRRGMKDKAAEWRAKQPQKKNGQK